MLQQTARFLRLPSLLNCLRVITIEIAVECCVYLYVHQRRGQQLKLLFQYSLLKNPLLADGQFCPPPRYADPPSWCCHPSAACIHGASRRRCPILPVPAHDTACPPRSSLRPRRFHCCGQPRWPEQSAVLSHCRQILTGYKVPSFVEILADLPRASWASCYAVNSVIRRVAMPDSKCAANELPDR